MQRLKLEQVVLHYFLKLVSFSTSIFLLFIFIRIWWGFLESKCFRNSTAQKANENSLRISALVSKMGQIKKRDTHNYTNYIFLIWPILEARTEIFQRSFVCFLVNGVSRKKSWPLWKVGMSTTEPFIMMYLSF